MIFRSPRQKKDHVRSWHRPDRPFFAAGACHVLAAAFLEAYPAAGFQPRFIRPASGLRGSHVFVSDGRWIFDYHGFSKYERYLIHYFAKMRRLFPGWESEVIQLAGSPIDASFCRDYHHRLPEDYLHDPLPRAKAYVARYPFPESLINNRGGHGPTRDARYLQITP